MKYVLVFINSKRAGDVILQEMTLLIWLGQKKDMD